MKSALAFSLMSDHVSTNAFKCSHIKNDFILSQIKSTNEYGVNATLTLTKEKYMQASSNRFVHIFQSSHNLVHARSQGSFRLVMGLRVKV